MKKILEILNNKKVQIFILFLLAFGSLLICTKNSPLYSFNDWVDGHAFFTMGKGIFNGKIPYKDLFEQKGPLLYLIYGIGYLISHDTFIGIFILECLSYFVFLYYVFLIAKYYLNEYLSFATTILTSTFICSSTAFVQGGSAEEFCLSFIACSTYYFIKIIYENNFNKKYLYINGIISGCAGLIKFNLLGFWFIWMALYFFKLISIKKIKQAFMSCGYFLLGMSIPILLSVVYFACYNALKDYFEVYIMFNLTSYSTTLDIKSRIINMLYAIYNQMKMDKEIFIIFVITLFSFLTNKIYKDKWIQLFLILSFIFLMIGVYIGGLPFIYYFLCFEFYIVFGFVCVFYFIETMFKKNHKIQILLTLISLCCSLYVLYHSSNIQDMKLPKKYYAQYVFKEEIISSKNPTILNYDNLDGGFYTTCNIVPNEKYFMRQNVDYSRYPHIIDGQNKAIKDKKVEYVIIREYYGNVGYRVNIPYLMENYEEIERHEQKYEGMDFTYYLYKMKRG